MPKEKWNWKRNLKGKKYYANSFQHLDEMIFFLGKYDLPD